MSKRKVKLAYLSMPITGYSVDERIKRADMLKVALAHEYDCGVISPFDAAPYDPNKPYGQCMKECISKLIDCDMVIFDSGWYNSNGCRIEAEVARGCEKEMIFLH